MLGVLRAFAHGDDREDAGIGAVAQVVEDARFQRTRHRADDRLPAWRDFEDETRQQRDRGGGGGQAQPARLEAQSPVHHPGGRQRHPQEHEEGEARYHPKALKRGQPLVQAQEEPVRAREPRGAREDIGAEAHEEGEERRSEQACQKRIGDGLAPADGHERNGTGAGHDRQPDVDGAHGVWQGTQNVKRGGDREEERQRGSPRPPNGAAPAWRGEFGFVQEQGRGDEGEHDQHRRGVNDHFVYPDPATCKELPGRKVRERFQDVVTDFVDAPHEGVRPQHDAVGPEPDVHQRAAHQQGRERRAPEEPPRAKKLPAALQHGQDGERDHEQEEDGLVEFARRLKPPGDGRAAGVADARPLEEADEEEEEERYREAELHVELDAVAEPVRHQDEAHRAEERRGGRDPQRPEERPEADARERPEEDKRQMVDEHGPGARQPEQRRREDGLRPVQRLEVERPRVGVVHVGVAVRRKQMAFKELPGRELQLPCVERRIPVREHARGEGLRPRPGRQQDRRGEEDEQRGRPEPRDFRRDRIAAVRERGHSSSHSLGFLQK